LLRQSPSLTRLFTIWNDSIQFFSLGVLPRFHLPSLARRPAAETASVDAVAASIDGYTVFVEDRGCGGRDIDMFYFHGDEERPRYLAAFCV
jgi:hypothetical protein